MFGEVESNFDLHIFCQLGWFKHQLDLICETLRGFETRKYHQNISDSGGLCCFLSFFSLIHQVVLNNQRVSRRRSNSCDVYKPLQKVKLPIVIVPLWNHFFGNPFSLTLIFVESIKLRNVYYSQYVIAVGSIFSWYLVSFAAQKMAHLNHRRRNKLKMPSWRKVTRPTGWKSLENHWRPHTSFHPKWWFSKGNGTPYFRET